jgi:multisubunit Na+/H+ antiporter MnhB subunit
MNSSSLRNIILEKIVKLFMRVMLIFSIYLLLRGHNFPGGGFIAGIVASTGFIFYAIIYGSKQVQQIIKIKPQTIIGAGLLLALTAGVIPVFLNQEIQTGLWIHSHLPIIGELHLGTPLLFDTGVFLVVVGVILTIIFSIMEVLKWN